MKNEAKKLTTPAQEETKNVMLDIVAGSYERLLYGLQVIKNKEEDTDEVKPTKSKLKSKSDSNSKLPYSIQPKYILPAHLGMIKCLDGGQGRYLATGSLYDLKTRKELGSLHDHKGSITTLNFVQKTHLISGSEDGTLVIWRVKDWEKLSSLKGHTGKISSVSAHPSGKLCISVGTDKLCLAFNLMTGQLASSLKLDRSADKVEFDKEGGKFLLMDSARFQIFKLGEEKPILIQETHDLKVKFLDAKFSEDNRFVIVGCSDGSLQIYGPTTTTEDDEDIDISQTKRLQILAHKVRIKAISCHSTTSTSKKADSTHQFLTSVSSDGIILVWDLEKICKYLDSTDESIVSLNLKRFVPVNKMNDDVNDNDDKVGQEWLVANYNAGVRFTCMVSHSPIG